MMLVIFRSQGLMNIFFYENARGKNTYHFIQQKLPAEMLNGVKA